jgi:hypothetical protein
VPTSWSLISLGVAGLALLVAFAAFVFSAMGLRRERERRRQRLNEAVFDWAGRAATKEELAGLRQEIADVSEQVRTVREMPELQQVVSDLGDALAELSSLKRDVSDLRDLRRAISELSDRVMTLEAEGAPAAEERPARFRRLPRL